MSCLRRLLLILLGCLLGSAAHAGSELVLDGRAEVVSAWPAVTTLSDPTQALSLDQVRALVARFARPDVPEANFGAHRDALWLHLPLTVTGSQHRWILEVDYPPLNRIEVHLVSDGVAVEHYWLGNTLPFDQRPLKSRAHAVMLDLPPGHRHEVFLRVHTASALLAPIRLYRDDAFLTHESARQILQGLLIGLTLAMLVYSVANGISLRDSLFWYYAAMLLGVTTFFVSYTGIGQQYLWDEQAGGLAKIAPFGILLALSAGNLFASSALDTVRDHPRVTLGLRLIAAIAMSVLLASSVGWLDYRLTQLAATVLGPVSILLSFRVSLLRTRDGDRMARWMVIGWGAYAVGASCQVMLLRGLLPAGFWTQHLFQFASMLELLAWMRVLGLRIEGIRRQAERVELEREALHSLAHTDPLTGLANRRGLNGALALALPQARSDAAVAVFLLDLDGFKPINDRLGHDAGDELLVQVGRRLKSQLRSGDLVARIGGDEFVVMSAGLANEADAQRVGRKLLDAFTEPFIVQGQACRVGMTIGYALSPQDGHDSTELLQRADAAMYVGKQGGRHRLQRGGVAIGLAG